MLVNGYANRPFDKRVKFQLFINNKDAGKFEPRGWIFSNNIGISNSGSIYVDITGDRKWQWGDFEQDFQLVIDQGDLDNADIVYYDAVGLRVTTKPGIDLTGNAPDGDLSPDTAIDPSQQVNVYNKVIGAELLWNENRKLQGKDIGVAVVDSGVYKTGDLSGAKVIGVNFNRGYHDSKDRYGHGTFVASVIAGSGKKSSGRHIGVAPKARVLNVRVSDDMGSATEADVVAGLQWVYENKDKYNIRVVNLSLNASVADSYLTSPLCAAVEMLWLRGIVVVVSAGNNGTATLFPPANDPFVITVGATDDRGTASLIDDVVASFSAYGLTEAGYAKPDLVAPGRNIIAFTPGNKDLTIGVRHPSHRINKNYFRMSGTSMSAPMVTGAVALLLQADPTLTPDQVKHRLLATANKNWPGYDPLRAGAGYLDIYSAVYTPTYERANAGVPVSRLLWESMAGTAWSSVNWNSVNWNSVNWNSVNWNSDYWEDDMVGGASYDRLLDLLADEPFDPSTNSSENLLYLPVVTR
ncbi:MAG: S8 family peptidase [Caldilineaceae bacterium]|nr:S8 family peptidase [Caldilineaceae bacterium]